MRLAEASNTPTGVPKVTASVPTVARPAFGSCARRAEGRTREATAAHGANLELMA
jgi:hypothetical protein